MCMIDTTLSDIGLIMIKKGLDQDYDCEIEDGIRSAVEETDFAFEKRTGWNFGPEGAYPPLEETVEELFTRHHSFIDRNIDWGLIIDLPQGIKREKEVARQACQITKKLLKDMPEAKLNIDWIPF